MKRVGEIKEMHDGMMTVEFCNHQSCENCHGCEGGQSTATLEMTAAGEIGDFAEVEMPTGTVVKASLLVYIFPLAAFLLGLGLGSLLMPEASPILPALLGFACLGLVVWFVHLGEKKRMQSPHWNPTLVRIIPRSLRDTPAQSYDLKAKGTL